jgi:hypothetical protein
MTIWGGPVYNFAGRPGPKKSASERSASGEFLLDGFARKAAGEIQQIRSFPTNEKKPGRNFSSLTLYFKFRTSGANCPVFRRLLFLLLS